MSDTIIPVQDELLTRSGCSERYEFSMTRCGLQGRGVSISRNVKGNLYLITCSGQVTCYDGAQIGFGGSELCRSDESEREWYRHSAAKTTCWSAMGRISRDYAIAQSPINWYQKIPFVSDLNARVGGVDVTITEEDVDECFRLKLSPQVVETPNGYETFAEAIWAVELWAEQEDLIASASAETCYVPRWAWPLSGKRTGRQK